MIALILSFALRALPDEIGGILEHGFKNLLSIRIARARAGQTQSHSSRVPHVGVIRLGEEADLGGDIIILSHNRSVSRVVRFREKTDLGLGNHTC
jgi:hypothetical protein